MKKLLIIFILIFITGCDSYVELNDLAVINTLGIEKDENYKIYAGITEITDKEALSPTLKVIEVEGDSLNKIVDKLSITLNKKIYMSHLNLLLINDTIKNQELNSIINYFFNNNETREDFLVANTSDIKATLDKLKFQEINELVTNNKRETSKTIYTTMYDVIKNYYDNNPIYFPSLKVSDNISLDGVKEYKNNKYTSIKEDDVLYLNYYLNNIDTYKYSYTCSDNKYLYLNILKGATTNLNNELLITNEIKVISNDCNYNKNDINKIFNNNLKSNLEKLTKKKITIRNSIRGIYEN